MPPPGLSIRRFEDLPLADFEPLLVESLAEGCRFLQRLQDDWQSGANRFALEGEAFFGAYCGAELIAVGGLNRQSPTVGRLRRFYVARSWRQQGVGSALVRHILTHAAPCFHQIVLHTDTAAADAFYRTLGFTRLPEPGDATHCIWRSELPKGLSVCCGA